MVLIHRTIRADLARLASLLGAMCEGDLKPGHARDFCRYTGAILAAVRAHDENEGGIVWPLVAATARQAVDLTPLTDDQEAIAAVSDRARHALARFAAEPYAHSAVALRASLSDLRELVDEHIADEESQLFPAIRRYLPAEGYRWCERQIMRRTSPRGLQFSLPWLARHARRDELAPLLSAGGRRARVVLALNRPRYARLERQAFSTVTHQK